MDPIYITFTCHLHTLYGIKTQWFRQKKYLRHTDELFKLIFFSLFSLKLIVLTLPVPSGTQKQSRRITAAPLPVLSVGQCPLSAHQTQPAFHLGGNDSLNKTVNVSKCSVFWDISTFLCFLPGESLPWSNTEIFKCLQNGPVLPLCTLGRRNGDDRIVAQPQCRFSVWHCQSQRPFRNFCSRGKWQETLY